MTRTWPGSREGSAASSKGASGLRSFKRLLDARRTTTAIRNLGIGCWNARLRSTVTKTSNSFSASRSSAPFLIVAQPICGTVRVQWPGKSFARRRSMHSSSNSFTSANGSDHLIFGGLEESDHPLTADCRKPFQKIVNRIARLKVIEQCLHRNPSPRKHRSPSQDVPVGSDYLLSHGHSISHGLAIASREEVAWGRGLARPRSCGLAPPICPARASARLRGRVRRDAHHVVFGHLGHDGPHQRGQRVGSIAVAEGQKLAD